MRCIMFQFDLISKLPDQPCYNKINFVPKIQPHQRDQPRSGLYFNKTVSCADDMAFYASQEPYSKSSSTEYLALGFKDSLQQAMMQAAKNPLASKAKYITFTCNLLGHKYGNPTIGVLTNEHPEADDAINIEYNLMSIRCPSDGHQM